MRSLKHILITRFNLTKRWGQDKKGKKVLDKIWLEDRYKLFEKYCLPSISNQTNQNFEWWVYFDKNLDSTFKKRNQLISKRFKNFIPKYETSYDEFEKNLQRDLNIISLHKELDLLITTRIDNDDVLAKDTIDLIQNEGYAAQQSSLLEIPMGYVMDVRKKNIKTAVVYNMKNPFISLVEKLPVNNKVKGVYYKQHNQWENIDSKIVSNKPQWIQVIHQRNLLNDLQGELVYGGNVLNNNFLFNKEGLRTEWFVKYLVKKIFIKIKIKVYRAIKKA